MINNAMSAVSYDQVNDTKKVKSPVVNVNVHDMAEQAVDDYGIKKDFTMRNLRFPKKVSDIDDDYSYNRHYVRFWINVDEESRIVKRDKGGVLTEDKNNTDQNRFRSSEISQARFTGLAGTIGAMTAVGSSTANSIMSKLIANPVLRTAAVASGGLLTGAAVAQAFNVTKKIKRLKTSITLYSPAGIGTNSSFDWGETDNMLNEILKTDKGAELFEDTSVAQKMTRIVGTNGSKELLGSLTRTAANKKKDLMFNSVESRTFSFDYTFMPRNAEEAIEVADIIYAFRFYSHPELIQGYDQFLQLYPAEWDIEYIYCKDGSEDINPFLTKISSCVLTNIDIGYANHGSYQSLSLGEPVETRVSLRFREIESLHQDRIAKGY